MKLKINFSSTFSKTDNKKKKKKKKKKLKLQQWQNIFNVNVSVNWIVQLAIEIRNGITKLAHVNAKVILHAKKILVVAILAHAFL